MTGRAAARASRAEALLERLNVASATAVAALERRDQDALAHALDARDALQTEAALALAAELHGRPAGPSLTALVDAAEQYQARLESAAAKARDQILAELATLDAGAAATTSYTALPPGQQHRLDTKL